MKECARSDCNKAQDGINEYCEKHDTSGTARLMHTLFPGPRETTVKHPRRTSERHPRETMRTGARNYEKS